MAIGCASVNYVGNYSDPTTSVDVYYSKEEIEKEFKVLGHAMGSGEFGASDEKIQKKFSKKKFFEKIFKVPAQERAREKAGNFPGKNFWPGVPPRGR